MEITNGYGVALLGLIAIGIAGTAFGVWRNQGILQNELRNLGATVKELKADLRDVWQYIRNRDAPREGR